MDTLEIEIDFLESEDHRPLFSVCDGSRLPAGVELEPMFLLPRKAHGVALRFRIKEGEQLRFASRPGRPHEGSLRFLDAGFQPVEPPEDLVGPRLAGPEHSECRLYWQRIDEVGSREWRFALFDLAVEPREDLSPALRDELRELIDRGVIRVDPAIAHPPPEYDPTLPEPASDQAQVPQPLP